MACAQDRLFVYAQLRTRGEGWRALSDRLAPLWRDWPEAQLMGAFTALFGMSNQDLVLLISLPPDTDAQARLRAWLPADVDLIDCLPMHATVRPADDRALTRAGIYVFRIWDTEAAHIPEIARLSDTAWTTFERDDIYRSEPMGLFGYADTRQPRGRVLLLTWYDNLTSWESSRSPHPEATANFRRRLALTTSAIAYATRLVETVPR